MRSKLTAVPYHTRYHRQRKLVRSRVTSTRKKKTQPQQTWITIVIVGAKLQPLLSEQMILLLHERAYCSGSGSTKYSWSKQMKYCCSLHVCFGRPPLLCLLSPSAPGAACPLLEKSSRPPPPDRSSDMSPPPTAPPPPGPAVPPLAMSILSLPAIVVVLLAALPWGEATTKPAWFNCALLLFYLAVFGLSISCFSPSQTPVTLGKYGREELFKSCVSGPSIKQPPRTPRPLEQSGCLRCCCVCDVPQNPASAQRLWLSV